MSNRADVFSSDTTGFTRFHSKYLYPWFSFPLFAPMLKISVKQMKRAAVAWFIIISILFFLPGRAFPKENWLSGIHFDKWVHFGFFALLLFLWRFHFPMVAKYSLLLLLAAFCYGVGVELIQHFFVANRSLDIGDIVADMAGAIAGTWYWTRRYIKK